MTIPRALFETHQSYGKVDAFVASAAAQRAKERVLDVKVCSPFIRHESKQNTKQLALFDRREVILGRKLGTGGFSSVYEIDAIEPNPVTEPSLKEGLYRDLLTTEVNSSQKCMFALKRLKSETAQDPQKFIDAAMDLVLESEMLRSLDHPHIIKLRGTSAVGADGLRAGYKGYFMIIEKLSCTLRDRLSEWRKEHQKIHKKHVAFWKTHKNHERLEALLSERLKTAVDIACAMEYLHEKNIILRDAKSSNIGFDVNGNVKLFDMGLARPLALYKERNGRYMLNSAGSHRYKAPEIEKHQPYNLKADVYSFGVILWEIMTMEYVGRLDAGALDQTLPIDPSWPDLIKELLGKALSEDMDRRPTIKEMRVVLEQELSRGQA